VARGPGAPGGDDYARLIGALREFLDDLSGASPPPDMAREIAAGLGRWSADLGPYQVPERDRLFGRRGDIPGRGQTMSPVLEFSRLGSADTAGTVRFGRYFLGRNGAVHGGAISLIFDEILGRVAQLAGDKPARTAYLHVNYRSITPADRDLRVSARLVSVTGRKRAAVGEIWHGEVLCADAEGLFVELRPGQP
jgi:acyl-coenzyme A thioesterase PaaI-like protein